jgi:hypothetical protein
MELHNLYLRPITTNHEIDINFWFEYHVADLGAAGSVISKEILEQSVKL